MSQGKNVYRDRLIKVTDTSVTGIKTTDTKITGIKSGGKFLFAQHECNSKAFISRHSHKIVEKTPQFSFINTDMSKDVILCQIHLPHITSLK